MRDITIIVIVLGAFLLALAATDKFLKGSMAEYVDRLPERTAWGLWRWAAAHEKHADPTDNADMSEYILLEDLSDGRERMLHAEKSVIAVLPRTSHKARKGL